MEKAEQQRGSGLSDMLFGGAETYGRHGENITSSSVQVRAGGEGACVSEEEEKVIASMTMNTTVLLVAAIGGSFFVISVTTRK